MNELDAPPAVAAGSGVDLRARGRPPALLRHHGDDDRLGRRPACWRSSSSSSTASAGPGQSTPLVVPSVRFEIAVIGVPLFFFLLWFVQGFKDYVWYTTPPKNTMDVYVMGKKWMWKFAYAGGGPNAIGTLHVPEGPAGAAAHDQPRRHPLLLRARLPHQAGRAAGPLHRDLVRGDQAGPLSDALRRVLRHLALADVGRGRGHAGAEFDQWLRAAAGPGRPRRHRRRRRRQLPRLDRRVRQEGRDGRRAA